MLLLKISELIARTRAHESDEFEPVPGARVSPAAFQVTVSVKRAPALRQPAGPGVPPGHWQCHHDVS